MKKQSQCQCKVKCHQIVYEPSLSYAQLSKFNIDRIVLNDPEKRALVNKTFLAALDISQKVVESIASADKKNLKEMKRLLTLFWDDIRAVQPAFNSDNDFATAYNILPFLEDGADFVHDDFTETKNRFMQVFEFR